MGQGQRKQAEREWVRVRTDDAGWVEGWLEAGHVVDGFWFGCVRYTLGIADTRTDWFPADRIRGGQHTPPTMAQP